MNVMIGNTMTSEMLIEAATRLRDEGGRMQMLYALKLVDGHELRYLTAPAGTREFDIWRVPAASEMPSLVSIWPRLSWYEREVNDMDGISFAGHPEPYPLLGAAGSAVGASLGHMPEIEAELVQALPFGPVRADVLESAEFTFYYIGEHIIHYHPHLFFKHRGMERRFEGRDIITGSVLAERVSGVGSLAHALAYAQAVEAAAGVAIPKRAAYWRVVLAELERLYNHLFYLGYLAETTTLKVAAAQGKLLAEQVKQINARLTGSRFLRSLVVPGGLRRDLSSGSWMTVAISLLHGEAERYFAQLEASASHFDRLSTTGRLPREIAFDQGATGPIERASGLDSDLRRDHPYAAYEDPDLQFRIALREEGDAYARAHVRMEEIEASIMLIQRALLLMEDGPVRVECGAMPGAEGLGWAESPRGGLFYAVHLDGAARLKRVKIKSPSFSNWRTFPYTVHETNMMDYAINEASFGLTVSGCAR